MTVEDVEILRALEDVTDPRESPVATPGDVAEELSIDGEAVRQRLMKLAADDEGIRTRKAGRARLFWTWKDWEHDDEPELEASSGAGKTHAGEWQVADDEDDVDEVLQEESSGADVDDDLHAEVLEELGDAAPKPPHAKDALVTIVQLLEEDGSMKTSDLKDEVHDRHGEHYGSKNAMWESLTRFFDESPHIEDGGWGVWEYSSPDRD